jgi:hypothetical protein
MVNTSDKAFLEDTKLSWEAKGVLDYMARNECTNINCDILQAVNGVGKKKARRIITELERTGYVTRQRTQDSKTGHFVWEGFLNWHPENEGLTRFIYLAKADRPGFKIGLSTNPKIRVKGFSGKLLYCFPADDVLEAERKLHEYFSSRRLKGEWFDLTKTDIARIKRISAYKNGKFYYTAEVADYG